MRSAAMFDSKRLRSWLEAAAKGASFLADRHGEDGAFRGAPPLLVCYYKSVSAFLRTGHVARAAGSLRHVDASFLCKDSTLDLGPAADNYLQEFQPYAYGWLAGSALMLGLLAHAHRLYSRMLVFKADGGGVLAGDSAQSRVCLGMTAWVGVLAQLLGDESTAREQASFLLKHIERQPDLEHRFLTALGSSGDFVSEAPSGKVWHEVNVHAAPHSYQFYWLPALVGVFLGKQYELSGDTSCLKGAVTCFDFLQRCGDAAFESSPRGKSGWAAAVLWRVTRERRYLDRALQVLDTLSADQSDDGAWLFREGFTSPQDQPVEVTLDMTAEFVHWICVIAGEVSL